MKKLNGKAGLIYEANQGPIGREGDVYDLICAFGPIQISELKAKMGHKTSEGIRRYVTNLVCAGLVRLTTNNRYEAC